MYVYLLGQSCLTALACRSSRFHFKIHGPRSSRFAIPRGPESNTHTQKILFLCFLGIIRFNQSDFVHGGPEFARDPHDLIRNVRNAVQTIFFGSSHVRRTKSRQIIDGIDKGCFGVDTNQHVLVPYIAQEGRLVVVVVVVGIQFQFIDMGQGFGFGMMSQLVGYRLLVLLQGLHGSGIPGIQLGHSIRHVQSIVVQMTGNAPSLWIGIGEIGPNFQGMRMQSKGNSFLPGQDNQKVVIIIIVILLVQFLLGDGSTLTTRQAFGKIGLVQFGFVDYRARLKFHQSNFGFSIQTRTFVHMCLIVEFESLGKGGGIVGYLRQQLVGSQPCRCRPWTWLVTGRCIVGSGAVRIQCHRPIWLDDKRNEEQ